MLGRASEIRAATIYDYGSNELGQMINKWLEDHPGAEILQIHFTTVCSSDTHGFSNNYSEALIIYRMPEKG
jgi:hypothetical protein